MVNRSVFWKAACTVSAAMVGIGCLGMALSVGQPSVAAADGEAATEGRIAQPTPNLSWEKWYSQYPDQVDSFFDGADEVEGDGKVHSHALLYATVPESGDVNHSGGAVHNPAMGTGIRCFSCKSTLATQIVDEKGYAGMNEAWADYEDQIDWWDCGLCHTDGVPGAELAYGGATGQLFSSSLLDTLPAEQAVCGQCHNIVGAQYVSPFMMPDLQEKLASGEVSIDDVDPYRYGIDPDAIMKAMLEDGYQMSVDEATGIATFSSNHPEVELFQGSVHEQLGMSCISCHMPQKTNEEGETYTSHNASSTPFENEEALEYCLTCHADQGVEDTAGMKQVILDAQADHRGLEETIEAKQAELYAAISQAVADGSVDEEVLDQVRETYTRATWWVKYADGWAEIKGAKVAHNPELSRQYVVEATQMVEDALELL